MPEAKPRLAVVPWDGDRLLSGDDPGLDNYPGLADYWRRAEGLWNQHRSSDRLTLLQRLDYRRGLSQQFPTPEHRVVYSKGGMYLAAARISDPSVVIDHKLYWGTAATVEEARYLVAILNTDAMTQRVRPLQARGEHNPRDFDKYVWWVPVPLYEESDDRHRALAGLSAEAEEFVASLDLSGGVAFEALRRRVRQELAASKTGKQIEVIVTELLNEQS
jgi:hypothetical protein